MTEVKLLILLVEDQQDAINVARILFENRGHEVVEARTFLEAVKVIHENKARFMVALVDIHLGSSRDGAGLRTLRYINNAASDRVVPYAWTGDLTIETHDRAIEAGVVCVLPKTMDFGALAKQLENELVLDVFKSSNTDKLTGLPTYRSFEKKVLLDLQESRIRGFPHVFSLIRIDVDDFKLINDSHGHHVGDEALKLVATTIREHVRTFDHHCREGGDEFLVWLRGASRIPAEISARKLKTIVSEAWVVGKDGKEVHPSISLGVAQILRIEIGESLERTLTSLKEKADESLRLAKGNKGR